MFKMAILGAGAIAHKMSATISRMDEVEPYIICDTAVEKAEALAKEAGARRALRLAVAGPFHCPLMQRAADEFEKAIADVKFNNPEIALFSNVTGKRAENGEEIKKNDSTKE